MLWLTRNPKKDFYPERPSGTEGPLSTSDENSCPEEDRDEDSLLLLVAGCRVSFLPRRRRGGTFSGLALRETIRPGRFGSISFRISVIGRIMMNISRGETLAFAPILLISGAAGSACALRGAGQTLLPRRRQEIDHPFRIATPLLPA